MASNPTQGDERSSREKARPAQFNAENILKLVQAVGMIVAGCWVLYVYFSFQKQSNSLTVSQQALAVRQAEIESHTREQANNFDLELKKLSVQQSQITLKTLENEQSVKLQDLRTSLELKKQDVELERLKTKHEEQGVVYGGQYRFSPRLRVAAKKIREDGEIGIYDVSVELVVENRSTVEFEVSYWCLDMYVGSLLEEQRKGIRASLVGGPPQRWHPEGPSHFAVKWEKVGTFANLAEGAVGEIKRGYESVVNETDPEIGGDCTGTVRPGGNLRSQQSLIVQAPKSDKLAFNVSLMFNKNAANEDLFTMNTQFDLPSGNETVESIVQ